MDLGPYSATAMLIWTISAEMADPRMATLFLCPGYFSWNPLLSDRRSLILLFPGRSDLMGVPLPSEPPVILSL